MNKMHTILNKIR